jgi:hypothetical protein
MRIFSTESGWQPAHRLLPSPIALTPGSGLSDRVAPVGIHPAAFFPATKLPARQRNAGIDFPN